MDEIILSEEEKKLILLYRIMKSSRERKSSMSESEDPSQVKIHVTEEMTFGEKLGG
jgi:predicted glycosyltransferase